MDQEADSGMILMRIIFSVLIISMLSACSGIEPWVQPYERANLADPIMNPVRDPVSESYIHHVYDTREGARGAGLVGGGGCGCN
jgi:hypothetical protein